MSSKEKTVEAMYDELVAAIVKAVPGIEEDRRRREKMFGKFDDDGEEKIYSLRPITLEDVLQTIEQNTDDLTLAVGTCGRFWEVSKGNIWRPEIWHLGHDLSWHRDNAPETIDFLHSILCV